MTEAIVKPFTHPLARKSTVVRENRRDGSHVDALLILTTLELDPAAKSYKADKVARLHDAARAYLEVTPEIFSFAVLNRPKDWGV